MLTGDLVRVKVDKNGLLSAQSVDPSSNKLLERAEELLAVFREGVGERRGVLDEQVEAVVGDGVDLKLTRGLVKLIEDRCTFEVRCPVPPAELRARVFAAAAARGPLAPAEMEGGRPTRMQLLAQVASELGNLTAEDLAAALYADHAERQVLTAMEPIDAQGLLERYNLALVQAVLFKATELRVLLEQPSPGDLRTLLRAVKFHQLIHSVQQAPAGWVLVLDGPASLFAQTTRYGLALAKFLPSLVRATCGWKAEARVAWTRGQRTMAIDSAMGLRAEGSATGSWVPREVTWLKDRWATLDTGWELVEDIEPLPQGPDRVVVPDLGFRKEGRVVWLEVLGFWRKASLAARLEGLRVHGPANLLVAVSSRMAGEKATLPDTVIPFAETINAREVLKRLEALSR